MTDAAWTLSDPVRTAPAAIEPPRRWEMPGTEQVRPAPEPVVAPVVAGPPAARAALHTAAAERLAERGAWEPAYRHLREAVRLLHGERSAPPGPQDELDRLRREHAEAHEQSRRDSLTASYNRRYLDERLGTLLDSAETGGVCLALADIDHFKQVNDTHGHPFGDRVLQRMVALLGRALPDGGFCARYGGEEFALVLPGHDLDDGVRICEAARDRIARHDWSAMHPDLRLTISVGVTGAAAGRSAAADVDALVTDADLLLYTAKQAGRNAVAYRNGGRVLLAGAAGGRRAVPQPAPPRPLLACARPDTAGSLPAP